MVGRGDIPESTCLLRPDECLILLWIRIRKSAGIYAGICRGSLQSGWWLRCNTLLLLTLGFIVCLILVEKITPQLSSCFDQAQYYQETGTPRTLVVLAIEDLTASIVS